MIMKKDKVNAIEMIKMAVSTIEDEKTKKCV